MAARNGVSNDSIQQILSEKSKVVNYLTHEPITYKDLVSARVDVDYVIRLERKNDSHTISNKTFDFSKSTVNQSHRRWIGRECSEGATYKHLKTD